MNQQSITARFQSAIDTNECFRRSALHECAWLRIENSAEEVVAGGVTDIKLDRRIELAKLDKIRREEISGLLWRLGLQCLFD